MSLNFTASVVLICFEYIVVLDEVSSQVMFFFILFWCGFFEITVNNGHTCNCLDRSDCFNPQSSHHIVYNNQAVSVFKVARLCLRREE